MQIEILHGPGNAAARIVLSPHETVTAEACAMIAMSNDVSIETSTRKRENDDIFATAKHLLANESFFLNHFTTGTNNGEIFLATTLPGDMMQQTLNGETLIVQSGSFVAC